MKNIKPHIAAGAIAIGAASGAAQAQDFELHSLTLKADAAIGAQHYGDSFGCKGGNQLPDLAWTNPPIGTRSFAVTLYDKDAPTGSGFWHWVVYDIPVATTRLTGGANGGDLPDGAVEGNTDLGKPGFFGPCPPPGRIHRYVYTVHALSVARLPVEKGASPAMVGFILWQHVLSKATLGFTANGNRDAS